MLEPGSRKVLIRCAFKNFIVAGDFAARSRSVLLTGYGRNRKQEVISSDAANICRESNR